MNEIRDILRKCNASCSKVEVHKIILMSLILMSLALLMSKSTCESVLENDVVPIKIISK